MNRRRAIISLAAFVLVTSCRSSKTNKTLDEPPYTPAEGAVGFAVQLVKGPPDLSAPTQWIATHKSNGRTAQFRIELGLATDSSASKVIRIRFGRGQFVSVAGSDATMLLPELQKALEAKKLPVKSVRTASLPFEYAILGERMYANRAAG